MGARSLVLIAILAAVCLAGFGVIEVDAQIVIWLLVAMAIAIVIASLSNRSGTKREALPGALIPATPMADMHATDASSIDHSPAADRYDRSDDTEMVPASLAPATTAEAVASVIGGGATTIPDEATRDAHDDAAAAEPHENENDPITPAAAAAELADDVDDDAPDGPDAEVIDIQRGRRTTSDDPADEESPVTTTARPTSIAIPEIEQDDRAVSPIRLPKPAARADASAPSLKVDRVERPDPVTPQLNVAKAEPAVTAAPVIATRAPEPTAPARSTTPTGPAASSGSALEPKASSALEPKIAAATRKAIADLVDKGRLSNEGPITDADVKTIVFLAISAEEVVALVDGGYVTADGGLTADRTKAKPFQAAG